MKKQNSRIVQIHRRAIAAWVITGILQELRDAMAHVLHVNVYASIHDAGSAVVWIMTLLVVTALAVATVLTVQAWKSTDPSLS